MNSVVLIFLVFVAVAFVGLLSFLIGFARGARVCHMHHPILPTLSPRPADVEPPVMAGGFDPVQRAQRSRTMGGGGVQIGGGIGLGRRRR